MNIFRKELKQEENTFGLELESIKTELADALESLKSIKEENIRLSEELAGIKSELNSKVEETEKLEETVEELEEKIEKKDEVIEEVLENAVTVEKRAAVKALEILADSGVEPVETLEGPETFDIMEQLRKLKGQELAEFYNKNKKEILENLKK